MDLEQFILEETLHVEDLTSFVLDEEEKKTIYWRVQDMIHSDNPLDEEAIDIEYFRNSPIAFPQISDLPKSYSFKKYQEYCMKNGLQPFDVQEEIDQYFQKNLILKRWLLYFHYAPFSYLLLLFIFLCIIA